MLEEIGLTDHCFKELLKTRKDYLLLLINGICNLDIKENDLIFGDTEERSPVFKTLKYDIKIVSEDLRLDIEAQKNVVNWNKNKYGEYRHDINRSIHYISVLHSKSYQIGESYNNDKKSIVIFIYLYDIPGNDAIQKINLHNNSTKVEYDNISIYSVSLAKIPNYSKLELERALKLLSEKDLTIYENDESKVIREACKMLEGYSKSEIAAMERANKLIEDIELSSRLVYAKEEGINEGIKKGKEEGAQIQLENSIKTMHKNGFDVETISKALSLDINFVNEVLSK